MSIWSLTYWQSILNDSTLTNTCQSFTQRMAAKTSWHRYGTKLRHCHPMYTLVALLQAYIHWKEKKHVFLYKNFISSCGFILYVLVIAGICTVYWARTRLSQIRITVCLWKHFAQFQRFLFGVTRMMVLYLSKIILFASGSDVAVV